MKVIILTLFVFFSFFYSFNGITHNKKASQTQKTIKDKENQNDTISQNNKIVEIKNIANNINKELHNYQKAQKTFFGLSTEGSQIISYYNKENCIKKIFVEHLGETGKTTEEYFFDKKELNLIIIRQYSYKEPIYQDNNLVVNEKKEEYFYFDRGKLFMWMDGLDKIIQNNENYIEKETKLFEQLQEYKKLFN